MADSYRIIVEGCIKQDRKAQKRLYELLSAKMMAVCYRYAKSRDQAEDMLQEGFIKVFKQISAYQFQGSFEGWVRRIMVHTAIDILRKEKNFSENIAINDSITDSMSADSYDHLALEQLMALIQQLPTGFRVVFNMYAIEGYNHAEIAQELGITESASRSQLSRAKVWLQKRIQDDFQPSIIPHVS